MTPVYRVPMRSRWDDIDVDAAVTRAGGGCVRGHDAAGHAYTGRLTGELRYDPQGAPVDLVNVRDTDWVGQPVDAAHVPVAVTQTFARGGRNLQQIHPGDVATEALWACLST